MYSWNSIKKLLRDCFYWRKLFLSFRCMGTHNTEKKVGFLLERTTKILKHSFIKALGKVQADITPDQWLILDTLYLDGRKNLTELATSIYKDSPTVSRIIDILEKKELVKKSSINLDRRKIIISISEQGRSLIRRCYPEISKVRKLSWKDLSDEDFTQFTRILDKMSENMVSYEG